MAISAANGLSADGIGSGTDGVEVFAVADGLDHLALFDLGIVEVEQHSGVSRAMFAFIFFLEQFGHHPHVAGDIVVAGQGQRADLWLVQLAVPIDPAVALLDAG